jgi:hypothetical protein
MACDCGCGGLSKGERLTLEMLRDGEMSRLPKQVWEQVVAEVEKAGSIRTVGGTAGRLLADAISKAYMGGSRSDAGRYAAQQRWKGHTKQQDTRGSSKRLGSAIRWDPKARKNVVKVKNVEEAYKEIAKGNYVEVESAQKAATIIEELGKYLKKVEKETGEKSSLDVCKISVPGTNLFCGDSIATEKYPQGVPRPKMPQLSGIPVKGSVADKEARIDEEGNVDMGPAFLKWLADKGVGTVEGMVMASQLKASQHQLKGKTVSYFMSPEGRKQLEDEKSVIYVSRDGYVIDGHHRWAGKVAADLKDGKTGDVDIRVKVIDMPIMEALDAALDFSEQVGIAKKEI